MGKSTYGSELERECFHCRKLTIYTDLNKIPECGECQYHKYMKGTWGKIFKHPWLNPSGLNPNA